ncbi:MAG: hypothetical protein D6717_06535 [Gammaproteobacteria bacterium]|nr:MAG: hypothetical protein D6717_06535 [Gammaproteobacteria bacterium]
MSIEGYIRLLLGHRRLIAATLLGLVLLASLGMERLRITTDHRVFFDHDNPYLAELERIEARYARERSLLFLVHPRAGGLDHVAPLQAIARLTERAWYLPWAHRVDSLANFQYSRAVGDELVVAPLYGDTVSEAEARRVVRLARKDPLLANRLVSEDGRLALVLVSLHLPQGASAAEVERVMEAARRLQDSVQADFPGQQVRISGGVAMSEAFYDAAVHDLAVLGPLMLGLIALLLLRMLCSWTGTLAALVVMAAAVAATCGLAGWFGVVLSPVSATLPVIVLTLAVANSVHLLCQYQYALCHDQDRDQAMAASLRANLLPMLLAAGTTILGFLSMNFSDAPPFRDLGNLVALGMAVVLVLALTLLPALVTLAPARRRRSKTRCNLLMERLGQWVVAHRRALLPAMLGLGAGLSLLAPLNRIDDQFIEYFDADVPFRQNAALMARHLAGQTELTLSIDSSRSSGINDPDFLALLGRFHDWLASQPEVRSVDSVVPILRRLSQNLHQDRAEDYRLPDSEQLAAQYLLLYELSLPEGLSLNDRIDVDRRATRLRLMLVDLDSSDLLALEQRIRHWWAGRAPADWTLSVVGSSLMFARISERNVPPMLFSAFAALALISLLIALVFRSPVLGLVSLVPNLLPPLMALGLWGLLVGEINLAIAVVGSMTIGLIVDDTVHFLCKFRRARRVLGLGPEDAVRHAFANTGTALWITTVVLSVGFMVFLFSPFTVNAQIGLLSAITIICALLADFLLLPPLLIRIEQRRPATEIIHAT